MFLATALLIALSIGLAVAVTSVLIKRIARAAAVENLESSASVQATLEDQRYKRLELICRLFVADPYLAAYLSEAAESRDTASILDLLGERRSDLGYDFAILVDPSGKVVARTDKPNAAGEDLSRRPLVAKLVRDFAASGLWQEGEDLYSAVGVPVARDFTVFGYLITGFAVDDRAAADVKKVSGADVAFVTWNGGQPQVVASTLEPPAAKSLVAVLRSQRTMMDRVVTQGEAVREAEIAMSGEPLLALAAPLKDAEGKPVGATVALASLRRELASYRRIELALVLSGVVSGLLAFALSYFFARRALAPVRRLVAATAAARQGNYNQKIAADRNDEVGQLARSFDELLSDLREKQDMEVYLTDLSKNLPEPAGGRAFLGAPQVREVLLLDIELQGYVRARPEAAPWLDRLAGDLRQVTEALAAHRGRFELLAGHRVLARFEGESRALRALAACAQILAPFASPDDEPGAGADEAGAPLLALAAGRVVIGPVTVGEQPDRALLGLPVQQVESLKREATPGELVLSRDVYEELRSTLELTGYRLAPRRGLVSPQPFYVLSLSMAVRLASSQSVAPGVTPIGRNLATLSGIEAGTLMAQRFEILAVLGSGGMGVVYKARDRELDDLVALKVLRRDLWGDSGQLERLKSELKLARKITHPNVLRTFDFGEVDGIPFISMEYVRGVTLRYMLDQGQQGGQGGQAGSPGSPAGQRLPYSAGLRLAKQLCAGLGAAHAVGVIHRDIKPENLILEPAGNAKLMDFGIARPTERLTPGQTQAGWVVGTPEYLAPELLKGEEASVRADIYSCGMVLYEIFTGRLPFHATTQVEMMMKQLQEEPPPPSELWPEIPPRLQAIILRCLRKEPAERYASVGELLQDLEELSA